MTSKDVHQEADALSLNVIQTGTDVTNYKILRMLPANTNSIMKRTGLTKMPVNVRLNKLQKMGLVKRWGYYDKTILTDLGKDLMCAVDKCRYMVMIKTREILESE